jgi:hypothetical protein
VEKSKIFMPLEFLNFLKNARQYHTTIKDEHHPRVYSHSLEQGLMHLRDTSMFTIFKQGFLLLEKFKFLWIRNLLTIMTMK